MENVETWPIRTSGILTKVPGINRLRYLIRTSKIHSILGIPTHVRYRHCDLTSMTIKVGIVGAGNIAKNRHAPIFRNNDHAVLTGILDRDNAEGRSVAENLDIPYRGSIQALCSNADLVSICTPPWVHREHTITALEHGCHVITEKPMAMTTEEAEEMIQVANENGQMLTVVQNFLFKDAFVEARELLRSGQLGELSRTFSIQLKKTGREDRHGHEWFEELPGGLFWDESPHMIYLTNDFIGDMELTSAETTPRDGEKQPHKTVRAKFENPAKGIDGNLLMLFDSPITEWWFVIMGSEGIVFIDIFRDTVVQFGKEDEHSPYHVLGVLLSGVGQMLYGGFTTGVSYFRDRVQSGYTIPQAGFSVQVERTLEALEKGADPPVTAQEGKNVVGWMEDIARVSGM